jgi:ABC-2 type transport system permease protein
MKALSYVLAVAWKELQVIAKDRGMLALFFLLPIILTTMQSGANLSFSEEEGGPTILLRVDLVNEDRGDFGREVTRAIQNIDELAVKLQDSADTAEARVSQGESAAAIIIPEDFSQSIDSYSPTSIEVVVDPAQPESASIVTGIMNQVVGEVAIWGEVQYGIRTVLDGSGLLNEATPDQQRAIEAQNLGVIMTRLGELRRNPAVAVVSEDVKGTVVESWLSDFLSYIFAGYTVMFIFFIVGTSAESLLTEREAGTLRRLIAAPIPGGAVVSGKLLAFMVIPCLQVVVLFSVASLFFEVSLGQSPEGLVLLTVIVAAVATGLGLLVSTVARTTSQAGNVGMILGFVLAIIGGALPLMPSLATRGEGAGVIIAKLTPHAHAVEGYYQLMVEDATVSQILPELGILLAFGAAFFLIAIWRFRYE